MNEFHFRCDAGFFGEFCVPEKPLPMTLRDDFEHGVQSDQWSEVYGADASDLCGIVVSGKALTFYKVFRTLPACNKYVFLLTSPSFLNSIKH